MICPAGWARPAQFERATLRLVVVPLKPTPSEGCAAQSLPPEARHVGCYCQRNVSAGSDGRDSALRLRSQCLALETRISHSVRLAHPSVPRRLRILWSERGRPAASGMRGQIKPCSRYSDS